MKVVRKESAQIIARSQSPKIKSVNVSTKTIFIDEALQYKNEALQHKHEALQYRNEIAAVIDEILGLKSIQPFTVKNYDLSFDDISNDGLILMI